jgi:hypothetical protein
VEGFCEQDNGPSGSMKGWEILEKLNEWRLHKKDSVPWSYHSTICSLRY